MLKLVSKKLEVARRRVKRRWKEYYRLKSEIYHDESLSEQDQYFERKSLLGKTYKKISEEFEKYRGQKYAITHKSDVESFSLSKRYQTINTNQFFYKGRSDYDPDDLDNLIPELLERKNVPGIVVTLKVKDIETDKIVYGSDFITKNLLKRLRQNDKSIYEHLAEKLGSSKTHVVEFELISIHIRIIYEKVKKS